MGRADLIGNGKQHLIPLYQPGKGMGDPYSRGLKAAARAVDGPPLSPTPPRRGTVLTQHTGLPPRQSGARAAGAAVRNDAKNEAKTLPRGGPIGRSKVKR